MKKERTAATDKTAATIYYAYSLGGRLIYEEEKESGAPTSTYYENVYAYGKNFALEEGTLDATGQPTATGRTYLHTDHLGSVIAATDTAGVTVWTNEYTPFGNSAEEAKRKDKYARFTGKQYDEEAGLYYFNMRWYDPETGRFTSEDPVKDGKAWYSYANNNPLGYSDPTGLRSLNEAEKSMVNEIFGPINISSIQIEDHSPTVQDVRDAASRVGSTILDTIPDERIENAFAMGTRAMSLPNNTVYVPSAARDTKGRLDALIMHEIAHQVLQYAKNNPKEVFDQLVKEALNYEDFEANGRKDKSKNVYDYAAQMQGKAITELNDIPTLEGRMAYIEDFVNQYYSEKDNGLPPSEKTKEMADVLVASGIITEATTSHYPDVGSDYHNAPLGGGYDPGSDYHDAPLGNVQGEGSVGDENPYGGNPDYGSESFSTAGDSAGAYCGIN